ncbi:MAG: MFS transporter, partial [Planctomycetia bacterium]|nr:MFS transporter [Planctomycetia bacterium]
MVQRLEVGLFVSKGQRALCRSGGSVIICVLARRPCGRREIGRQVPDTVAAGFQNSKSAMIQGPARGASTMGALWLCFGAMMCQAIIVMLPPTYLTTFGETFGGTEGLSNEQLGRIPAVIFASLVLTVLVTGPLADRWGTKLFAMLGLGLTSAGLGALAAAGSYEMLLAAACLMGLGAGMIEMVLNPMVCALQPQRRASAMNWLHSFYCIGALGTVLICSQALAWHIPWRTVTFVMILLPVAVLAGFAWL